MIGNENNPETVHKKLEDLDKEVNTFIQVVKEVKEMKDSAEVLQEKLVRHEVEIEQQKNELGQLISTTKNLGINIEEQTKGVIFDLEMKTDELIREVKSGISQISNICAKGSVNAHDQHDEALKHLENKYEETQSAYEAFKTVIDDHEQKIESLNKGYAEILNGYDKMESMLTDLKKTVYEIQKRPYEFDYKLTKMEERLELSINEKYSKQKNITLIVLLILIAAIFLSVISFYFS
jgi:chromosome segregation ATPase